MPAHGLMFHHFYDDLHPKGQGAISADDFSRILDHYGERLLSAGEWTNRALLGELRPDDVCVTFDDALKCQVDIALPVLEERKIAAFWFVYSSVLTGGTEYLEVFRYFRTVYFAGFNEFFNAFMCEAQAAYGDEMDRLLRGFVPENYLAGYPFYTREDRIFRYVRDGLGTERYERIMLRMMRARQVAEEDLAPLLWMTADDVRRLAATGHVVGLHSHTHPLTMGRLPRSRQMEEYALNHEHLNRMTGAAPFAMSHPCNSYNADTLDILSGLGIKIGFAATMKPIENRGPLEWPREDHANVAKELGLQ